MVVGTPSPSGAPLTPSRPTSIELPARHRLEPFAQGTLDGLCGLYATINAFRLGLVDVTPLTKAACKKLFAEGIGFLDSKGGLEAAATTGMGTKRRQALARYLANRISGHSVQVEIERPDHRHWATIGDAFAWIEDSLAQGKPVLVTLMGGLDHYTVVVGTTPATLLLFDSTGIRFVRKSSCGLRGRFHTIPPSGLSRVAVQART